MFKKISFQIMASNWLKEAAIGLFVFAAILAFFLKGLESNPFHPDENLWIKYGSYFKLFWIDKDFGSAQWQEWNCIDQPCVGKYIAGLSIFMLGKEKIFQELGKINYWDFSRDEEWNRIHGAMPPPQILFIARLTMAIFGALACLLVYVIGAIVFGKRAGIIAALLLACNPLVLLLSRRAVTDVPVMFFMTMSILLSIGFYSALLRDRKILFYFTASLIGINNALALGTKYIGGLSAVIFTLFCIIICIIRIKADKRLVPVVIGWLTSILALAIVFFAVNPYFYREPFKRITFPIQHQAEIFRHLQAQWPAQALTSLSQKAAFVMNRSLMPQNNAVLGRIFNVPVDLALFLMGLVLLFYTELICFLRTGLISHKTIILIWALVTFSATIAWIPMAWDRYNLPVMPCIAVTIGYSLDLIIGRGLKNTFLRKK